MSRVPIRLRLTLAFTLAMAVVLAVIGFLLYSHLAGSLDRTLNQGLRARAADVSALVTQADTGLSESRPNAVTGTGIGFAQVLDARGGVFDETRVLADAPYSRPASWRRPAVPRCSSDAPIAVERASACSPRRSLRRGSASW